MKGGIQAMGGEGLRLPVEGDHLVGERAPRIARQRDALLAYGAVDAADDPLADFERGKHLAELGLVVRRIVVDLFELDAEHGPVGGAAVFASGMPAGIDLN